MKTNRGGVETNTFCLVLLTTVNCAGAETGWSPPVTHGGGPGVGEVLDPAATRALGLADAGEASGRGPGMSLVAITPAAKPALTRVTAVTARVRGPRRRHCSRSHALLGGFPSSRVSKGMGDVLPGDCQVTVPGLPSCAIARVMVCPDCAPSPRAAQVLTDRAA